MKGNRLGLGLQTKLAQKLLITPQMKQSLSILQMPIMELLSEINTLLEENPVLDQETPDGDHDHDGDFDGGDQPDGADADVPEAGDSISDDLLQNITSSDWDDYIGEHDDLTYRPLSDDEGVDFEKFVRAADNLFDHLRNQLTVLHLSDEENLIGEYIIGNLGDDGYFRNDLAEVAEELGVAVEDVERVLHMVQTFDPAGIASRTLQECIQTQLADCGTEQVYIDLIGEMMENYEEELKNLYFDEIQKKLCIEEDTFEYLLFLMRKTDPRPGLNYAGSSTQFIVPDVYIVKKNDDFEVILNEEGMPSIKLNSYYLKMLKAAAVDDSTKEYIEEKVKNAVWLIKSLHKRQKAIYRVVEAIVEYQKDCFARGMEHLKPLRLKDIAEKTELHESTVSRVTSGKYAMTSHGLIEIKSFFVKGLDSGDGDVSTQKIKRTIKEVIDEEPKDGPFSDQKIVEILEKKGIKIARRTVAKYREELNIPTRAQRKRIRR